MPRFRNIRIYVMIKTITKILYSTFITIIIISIILAGWTSYAFISQSSKSTEIINVIQDIYVSQKSVVVDVIELSKILIKGKNKSEANEKDNILLETDVISELENNLSFDDSTMTEDNGDNPLGIVIEPSLPDINENTLPEITEEPLVKKENELSTIEKEMGMGMGMDMNF